MTSSVLFRWAVLCATLLRKAGLVCQDCQAPISPWRFSMGFPANSSHEQCDPALLFQAEAEEVAAGTTWDVGAASCDVV